MNRIIKAVLLLGFCLSTPVMAAGESGPARAELERFANQLKSFQHLSWQQVNPARHVLSSNVLPTN